ncbi:MAG: hypothetical protein ACREU6_15395 [Steroidobacteraceae bacterium]
MDELPFAGMKESYESFYFRPGKLREIVKEVLTGGPRAVVSF